MEQSNTKPIRSQQRSSTQYRTLIIPAGLFILIILLIIKLTTPQYLPLAAGNVTILNINAPSNIQRNNVFQLTANLTTSTGITGLNCSIDGEITDFYNITDYPLTQQLGNFSAGDNHTITWILAAPYTLGYYTLNISCNVDDFTTPNKTIKIIRG